MIRFPKRPWLVMMVLAPALVLAGCGDDDDSPTGPEDNGELSEGAALFQELGATLNQAAALLFTGGGEIQGEQGTVVVVGSTLTFNSYSPDSEVVIDGQLEINLLVQPVAVTGQLELTGEPSGTADVNVTIDLATSPPTYGGTIVLDGEVYDVVVIVAEAAAQEDD